MPGWPVPVSFCAEKEAGMIEFTPERDQSNWRTAESAAEGHDVSAGSDGNGRRLTAVILCCIAALSVGIGCWSVFRTTGAGESAAAEANLNLGGRITDRIDDVNDALEDQDKLLRETQQLVQNSESHYEEIGRVLEEIQSQIDAFEQVSGLETSGTSGGNGREVSAELTTPVSGEIDSEARAELSGAVDRLNTQIRGLIQKTNQAKESSAVLEAELQEAQRTASAERKDFAGASQNQAKELDSSLSTMRESLNSRYQTYRRDYEALNQALTGFKTSLVGMIEEFEAKDGAQYQSLTALLSSTGAAVTDSVDTHQREISALLGREQEQLADVLRDGTREIVETQQESFSVLEEHLASLTQMEEELGEKYSSDHTEHTQYLEQILSKSNYTAEQTDALLAAFQTYQETEEGRNDAWIQLTDRITQLTDLVGKMEQGMESVLLVESDSRKMLIAALREKQVVLDDSATFEDIRDGILSIASADPTLSEESGEHPEGRRNATGQQAAEKMDAEGGDHAAKDDSSDIRASEYSGKAKGYLEQGNVSALLSRGSR